MAKQGRKGGFSKADSRDTAIASYALMQSLMVTLVAKQALTVAEGAEVLSRAAGTLRRRSSDFEKAAAMLDQEAAFWRSH